MKNLKRMSLVIPAMLFLSVQLPVYGGPVEAEKPERAADCELNPFAQWCSVAGFGVGIGTSIEAGSYIGVSGSYGLFIFERAALTLGGSYTAFEKYDTYAAGPRLSYYIGPVADWFLIPGVTASRVWFEGSDISVAGYTYGPGATLQSMIGMRFLYGISAYYVTSVFNNRIYSEMQFAPAVSFLF